MMKSCCFPLLVATLLACQVHTALAFTSPTAPRFLQVQQSSTKFSCPQDVSSNRPSLTLLQSAIEANGYNANRYNNVTIEANGYGVHTRIPNQLQQQQLQRTVQQDVQALQKKRALSFMNGLALNSGFLNGIFLSGILGRVQAVGPVTDSWTKNAVGFATGDTQRALFIAQVLLSFGGGAFLQGWLNPSPQLFDLEQRKRPLLISGLCMALSTALVWSAHTTRTAVPPVAFFLVCAANGIQNSFSSFCTANMCRTSHFTGTTTDLFTIVAQCLRGNTEKKERIPVYTKLTAMFWLGGFVGTRWTKTVRHASICLGLSSGFYLMSSLPWAVIQKKVWNRRRDHAGYAP